MLIHPVLEQLQSLRFTGMAEALSEQLQDSTLASLSFEERLGFLVEREASKRSQKLLQSRLKQAKLHLSNACLEDVNFNQNREIDKSFIAKLGHGSKSGCFRYQ